MKEMNGPAEYKKLRILIVDDDPVIMLGAESLLSEEFDAEVETAGDCAEAREQLSSFSYDLVTLDNQLPDGTGIDLLKEIRKKDRKVPVIMMTGAGDEKLAVRAFRLGATNYVIKDTPELSANLCEVVKEALARVALAQAQDKIRFQAELLDAVQESIIATNVRGEIIYWNHVAEEFYGWKAEDIIGTVIKQISPESDDSKMIQEIVSTVANGNRWSGEHYIKRRDKASFWVMLHASPIYDRKGYYAGMLIISFDISQQKQLVEKEKKLAAAEVTTEMAQRKAEEFKDLIDIAAHELRHPATILKSYAYILLSKKLDLSDEIVNTALESINKGAMRVAYLATELMDASRVEKMKMGIRQNEVSPAVLLSSAIQRLKDGEIDCEINIRTPSDEREVVLDQDMIVKALLALLDNAVKYSPETMTVDVWYEQDDNETRFFVADRGPGIPEKDREKIFDPFYQVEDVLHHSLPGIGLGLYIMKRIVHAHDGWLDIKPREGRGAVFSFGIPG